MNYFLDACALLAFLNDEEGAEKIEDFLNQAATKTVSVSMSIVNFLEVYYGELRDKGSDIAQIVLDMVRHYSIKIVNTVSTQVFQEAARLKVVYKMSLADCVGLATAIEFSGQFISSDHHELDKVSENESNLIYWFRQHNFTQFIAFLSFSCYSVEFHEAAFRHNIGKEDILYALEYRMHDAL